MSRKDQVEFLPNRVRVGNQEVAWDSLISNAYMNRVPLSATGFYQTPDNNYDPLTMRGQAHRYHAYGASCSEVLIDVLTGENKVVRVDILHEMGRSINPAVDYGQLEGGFIQGMGWLTTEEVYWDDAGTLLTHAPSTYKIPVASDRPDLRMKLVDWSENRGRVRVRIEGHRRTALYPRNLGAQRSDGCRREHRESCGIPTPECPSDARTYLDDDRRHSAARGGIVKLYWRERPMLTWITDLNHAIERDGACVLVTVARARGSTPREAGAKMVVTRDGAIGTIGGGNLELLAIDQSRKLINQTDGQATQSRTISLGPSLGQCCGGSVDLLFEPMTARPCRRGWRPWTGQTEITSRLLC